MSSPKVCILLPTTSCSSYFSGSFPALAAEITLAAQAYELGTYVLLNGSGIEDEVAVRQTVCQFGISVQLIVIARPGKNNAINVGVASARDAGFDIVHVVDDDQLYEPQTIKRNIDTLVGLKTHFGLSGLVGARHLVDNSSRSQFAGWIASLAFEERQEAPKFCIGGCMCGYVADFPTLPDDSTGIADDAYVSNYYFIKHYEIFKATGLMPIVFPKESRLFFRSAQSWSEYRKQQIRIRYGVLAAYAAFPAYENILREYFCWRFHCDEKLERAPKLARDLVDYIRWRIFRNLRRRVNTTVESLIKTGAPAVQWNVAKSTKSWPSSSVRHGGSND